VSAISRRPVAKTSARRDKSHPLTGDLTPVQGLSLSTETHSVIAGLAPAIHPLETTLPCLMDARVRAAHNDSA